MFDLDLDAPNVMPSRYRQVTTAAVPSLDPEELRRYFSRREAYRRTRFVVARLGDRQALVELARTGDETLFSDTIDARIVAGPDECVWVSNPSVDCAIASHLAAAAGNHPEARCVVVEGLYEHVSFLLNPAPIEIEVLDIVPPRPSKLLDQARRVLDVAEDLPPILLRPHLVDSVELLANEQPDAQRVLVPCRGGGVEVGDVEISFLDERPPQQDWALLGCQRSQQIHQWFYREEASPRVDSCPRRFLDDGPPTGVRLSRCCLRESGIDDLGDTVLVPWGSSLGEVRLALERIVANREPAWTRL